MYTSGNINLKNEYLLPLAIYEKRKLKKILNS